MTDGAMSRLRRRMIEDMTIRKLRRRRCRSLRVTAPAIDSTTTCRTESASGALWR